LPAAAALHVAGGTELETFVRLQMRSGTIAASPCEADCTRPATNVPCHTQSEVSVFFARKFHPGWSVPPRFGATPVSATPTEPVAAAAPVNAASVTPAATIAIVTRRFDPTCHPLSRTLQAGPNRPAERLECTPMRGRTPHIIRQGTSTDLAGVATPHPAVCGGNPP